MGKCLVVSLFDSGPLVPTEAEVKLGWQEYGRLAMRPRVDSVADLPHDQYDEWYVFASPTTPEIPEAFIDYPAFTLEPMSVQLELDGAQTAAGSQADGNVIKQEAYKRQQWIDMFWEQMELVRPESYIGDGDNFAFATIDRQLFEKVRNAAGG